MIVHHHKVSSNAKLEVDEVSEVDVGCEIL